MVVVVAIDIFPIDNCPSVMLQSKVLRCWEFERKKN